MNRIVLIGPPGSGKSTVGAALAHKLNIKFVDTDLLIEQREGKTITDIFVVDGEPHFRALELETLTTVLAMDNVIIGLGGGAPVSEQAQQEIRSSDSTVIFLDVSLATAAPRVGFNRDRPLLLGNPRAQWQALSDKRRPIYEDLADLSVKVDDMSVEQIISDIELKLR
jgi:shikimate kinase